MFETIFWATGAFILSYFLWQLGLVAIAGIVVGLVRLAQFVLLLPLLIVMGIWNLPRGIYRFFTCGWVREFAWAAAVCLIVGAILMPFFPH